MSSIRFIVNTGKKVSDFFANDLQNHYYKHLFLNNAKRIIGSKSFPRDKEFEKESKLYWKEMTNIEIDPIWHSFYSYCNGIKDVRYVPENLYYAYIEPYYNKKQFSQCCDDKCYYSERFPDHVLLGKGERPTTILRNISGLFYDSDFNILSRDKAIQLLAEEDSGYVIKESITGTGGNRLLFVDAGQRKSIKEIGTFFDNYSQNFVVEGLITQCKELEVLNSTSINTIRFITYMDERGVHVLSSVFRIGGKNSRTDNFSTGGIACGIDEKGDLKQVGYNQKFERYNGIHPNGTRFANHTVPRYAEAKELVTILHHRFGHFRIISWDIAISEDYKPVIIEFNLTPQSIDFHQINNGPLFGYLTEKILEEVFARQ